MKEEEKKNLGGEPVTPDGSAPRPGFELKTYSVKEILLNFVPERATFGVEHLLDPKTYTAKNLIQGSVSFGVWLCLLPLMCTFWCF